MFHVPSVISQELMALGVTALGFGIAYVQRLVHTKLSPKQLNSVHQIAGVAVQAAEQFGKDHGSTGAQKLLLAEEFVVNAAKNIGLKLSDAEVDEIGRA